MGLPMHEIMFGTKRAFHSFLRVSRKPLVWLELTAARFDMMAEIVIHGRRSGSSRELRQSELRKMLGVTASVVTRMAKSLEALGLVQRKRELADRRQVCVTLTERGKERVLRAWHVMTRAMRRFVDDATCEGDYRDPDMRLRRMKIVNRYLTVLRFAFGDWAVAYYFPWGYPD
jgi:DNA-binding MarR family transcriptional regulator